MLQQELTQRIGRICGYIISRTDSKMDNVFTDQVLIHLKTFLEKPPLYKEVITDTGEILKWITKNENLKDLIDGASDLAVHEEDESLFEEIRDAFNVFIRALKTKQ